MKTALGVMMLAIWVGAWACGGDVGSRGRPCQQVQLAAGETAQLTSKDGTVYLSTQSDTIHKPYAGCVTFLADTVHKPL